jgi:hypothetical protein
MTDFGAYRDGTRRAVVTLAIFIGSAMAAATPARAVCILTCPADIIANTQDPDGVVVDYDAPTAMGCTTIEQTQGLPSGYVFPPGTTMVGFRDQTATSVTCSFTVTVNFYDPKAAPVLDPRALVALAVVLAGFGLWSARRHFR